MSNEETRFKAGVSGNPKGRPKGSRNRETIGKWALSLCTDVMGLDGEAEKLVDKMKDLHGEKITTEEALAILAVHYAAKGSSRHYEIVLDNAYGKLAQKVEATVKTIEDELDDIPDEDLIE